jgi:hypothetical protein
MSHKDPANLADFGEQQIAQQAANLTKDIQPKRELWPEIAQRIKETPQDLPEKQQNRWLPFAMAASLMIALGSLGFAGYTNMQLQEQLAKTAESEAKVNAVIDSIEQPYRIARTSYLNALATQEQYLSPEDREVLRKNLKIINDAANEIRAALVKNPNDPLLIEALILTHNKELALLNQLTNQGLDTI